MRRAALKPATSIWTNLLVVLALCLGACASRPATPETGDAEALLDLQPDGAFSPSSSPTSCRSAA